MRNPFLAAVTVGIIALGAPLECSSEDRAAYLFRYDDTALVRVPLVEPPSFVYPSIVAEYPWTPIGSTRHPDGRILTMNATTDALVAVTPTTGEVETLTILQADVGGPNDDLFWGIDGRLMYTTYEQGQTAFYSIDLGTGALTFDGSSSEVFETIEKHDDQYYGGAYASLWRIDPVTYAATLILSTPGYQGPIWWGLASVDGNLWFGKSGWNSGGINHTTIGTIDPLTGQETFYGGVHNFFYSDQYLALEITRQSSSAPIPVLPPIGLFVFTMSLMAAGALMLMKK